MADKVESIEETPIVLPKKPYEDITVDDMDLSVRSFNCLRRAGLDTVADVVEYIRRHGSLKNIRNLGTHSQCEVYHKLKEYGIEPLEVANGANS